MHPFRTIGRSGLVVSPLALGTMTFGAKKWGSPDEVSEAIFNAYVDSGGNHVDTADVYAGGRSEELVGEFVAKRGLRDRVVLATKFTFNGQPGNPNAGGNGRKNLHRALEGSLRRLKTDYIDLYYTHFWDRVTPTEEVLESLGALQRAGKIRYFAFSDLPAWYAVRAATLAQANALPGPIAMQLEYSLIERTIEVEHVPAGRECGLGVVPWGPIAAGFLSGKYSRTAEGISSGGRFDAWKSHHAFGDREWNTLETLRTVAAEQERPMAQVALAWVLSRPGVSSVLTGAREMVQFESNLAALEVELTPAQLQGLNAVSAPQTFFNEAVKKGIFGGKDVRGW